MSESHLPVPESTSALLARLNSGTIALPFGREILLLQCHVAGTAYRELDDVYAQLEPGEELMLRREPDNPHDPRAIEVFWRKHKLGYLPRLDNAAAASLADRSHALHAEIIAIDDPDEEWEPVRLRVWVSNT